MTTRVLISGMVVNIGFRAFVLQSAVNLGICGWVKNTSEGKVEALFSGSKKEVKQILILCRQGPSGSFVENVKILEENNLSGSFSGFRIVY